MSSKKKRFISDKVFDFIKKSKSVGPLSIFFSTNTGDKRADKFILSLIQNEENWSQ